MILIKIIGHHINMLLRGYKKGLTSSDVPSNFDLDAMPNGMRHNTLRNATYYKVWYKHKNGQLIKKPIRYTNM